MLSDDAISPLGTTSTEPGPSPSMPPTTEATDERTALLRAVVQLSVGTGHFIDNQREEVRHQAVIHKALIGLIPRLWNAAPIRLVVVIQSLERGSRTCMTKKNYVSDGTTNGTKEKREERGRKEGREREERKQTRRVSRLGGGGGVYGDDGRRNILKKCLVFASSQYVPYSFLLPLCSLLIYLYSHSPWLLPLPRAVGCFLVYLLFTPRSTQQSPS
jgi:hypothetical protein